MNNILSSPLDQPSGAPTDPHQFGFATTSTDGSAPPTTTASSNQYNNGNGGMHKIQSMAPVLLISLMGAFTLALIYVIYRGRQRRMELEAEVGRDQARARQRSKKKKRVVKPKLWDVNVGDAGWDADLEALLVSYLVFATRQEAYGLSRLQPVAAQLERDPRHIDVTPPASPKDARHQRMTTW
jgi:hypothetical protein